MSSRLNNGINVTGGNTSQQVEEDITSPAVDGNSRKRVRGPTYMPRIWAREEEDRIRVSFNEHGQPVDNRDDTSHLVPLKNQDGQRSSILETQQPLTTLGMSQHVSNSTRQPNVWVNIPSQQKNSSMGFYKAPSGSPSTSDVGNGDFIVWKGRTKMHGGILKAMLGY